MSVTNRTKRTVWSGGLFLGLLFCLLMLPLLASEQEVTSLEDSLVRVIVRQTYSGIIHREQLLAQSTVVQINEFGGVVVDARGYVVAYVGEHLGNLENPAAQFAIEFCDGDQTSASLVGVDERVSLAVLKAASLENRNIIFGNSLNQRELQVVGWKDTEWDRSSLRVLGLAGGNTVPEARIKARAETDKLLPAAGSFVLDNSGRLLGILTKSAPSGVSRQIGTYDVLPSLVVRDSLKALTEGGRHIRAGWLGIFLDPAAKEARVDHVVEGSPADNAGLLPGDLFLEVDGQPIRSKEELVKVIRWKGATAKIELTMERNKAQLELHLELVNWPADRQPAVAWALQVPEVWHKEHVSGEEKIGLYQIPLPSGLRLGLAVDSLTPQLARYFGSPSGRGLLVKSVLEGSPGSQSGFRAGDILLEINGTELATPTDLKEALTDKEGVYLIKYLRDGTVSRRKIVLH